MILFSYFTSALRGLLRQKRYLFINLMGLAVGIAAYMVIMLYVTHEKEYDKHIEQRDRIFRVVEIQDEPGVGNQHVAITMAPLAREMKNYFPQIEETVRILPAYGVSSVGYGDKLFRETKMICADPSIIDMFSIRFIRGNENLALRKPNTIVVSEDIAKKYFETVDKAYNSVLMLDNESFRIEGIFENQPTTSHMFFNIIISMSSIEGRPGFEWMTSWGNNSLVTYVLLNNESQEQEVEAGLKKFVKEKVISSDDSWGFLEMYLQPVNEIYLKSNHIKFQIVEATGDSKIITIFTIIAALILLIACVNYINISLARSVKQSKEVGMRKVLGADRMSLIYRYISESFLITLIAILFSIGLLELVLPEINSMLGTSFILDFSEPLFNIGLVVLLIVISLVSGSYPAFYLSRYQPISVLKGGITSGGKSGILSKSLMVFQFAVSIGLIFSILMINDQIKYIQNKDLGINYNNSIFAFFGSDDYKKLDVIKQSLMQNPAIKNVSGASFLNGVSGSQGPIFIDDSVRTQLTVRYGYVDHDFFSAMDIKLVDGRNFNPAIYSDSAGVVILNQSAISKLGWDDLESKRLSAVSDDTTRTPYVIGVINDYHYYSLRTIIEPAAYFYDPARFNGVVIKYSSQTEKSVIDNYVEARWKELLPKTPYRSISDDIYLAESYRNDLKIRSLFVYFAIISLFLSCLGLYGLTSLLIEQKTKIIGIKKVLGSPVRSIIVNLVKEYMILVALAGIVAIPLSLMFVQRFLNNYPYRVEISFYNILFAVTSAVVIAFITVIFKAGKTANSNPLEALKYE
jgi:putative ABC transport system permease protein